MEFVDEAGPGDFVYVAPYVPHQELNASKDEPVEAVIVRSGQEPVVINLDIPSPEDAPNTPKDDVVDRTTLSLSLLNVRGKPLIRALDVNLPQPSH